MPRRIVRPCKLEIDLERIPLKPGEERRLLKLALHRAPGALQEWHEAQNDEGRFHAAPQAAIAAFNLGQYELAEEVAGNALDLAMSFTGNWNVGNAVHYGRTTLGLLSLRSGDLPLAAQELQRSGDITGSPQLNSFGPSMQLAKALLKNGAGEPVLAYFQQCRNFWSMGSAWLDVWERKVRRGVVPNFFMHSYR